MAEVQYAPGTTIFVPSDANGWEAMTVDSCTGFGEAATIRAHQTAASARGGSVRVLRQEEVSRIQECDVLALEGAPDMVKFAKLSEATLLHNLRVRYARDDIYTRAGSILISVNPFKRLSIYTPERMAQCKDADAKALQDLEPHVYALAEAAFRGILVEQRQQSILISGESGAGKTEAVKACLQARLSVSHLVARASALRCMQVLITTPSPLPTVFGRSFERGDRHRSGACQVRVEACI
jgi:myosin-5